MFRDIKPFEILELGQSFFIAHNRKVSVDFPKMKSKDYFTRQTEIQTPSRMKVICIMSQIEVEFSIA